MPINSFEHYPMSWKPSIDRTRKPIYKTLAQQLQQDIVSGVLLPGTKLPPQRELADFLDLNVSTVSKAIKTCELKGLLSAAVGSGTFVSYDAVSNAYLLEDTQPQHLIEMGATMPDSHSYEPLAAQLRSMLQEPDYAQWFGYGRIGELRWKQDAAMKLLRRSGLDTDPDRILLASGGQNAIAAILAGLCKPGDRIGADLHTYPGLKTAAAMLSIQVVPIRSEQGVTSPEAFEYACKNDNIKGLYLIPDYHNPTAVTMPIEIRKRIAEVAQTYDQFIIEDGAYSLMHETPLPAVTSFAPEQGMYIASLSKSIAPGLRLAYIAVPERYKEPIAKALYNLSVSVAPLFAELAARMIVSNQFESLIEAHRKQAIRRNRIVDRELADYRCIGGDTGIFRWLLLPDTLPMTGAQFEHSAARHGVQVYAADRFVVGNTAPERAVRLAVCAPGTVKELETGIAILRRILSE